MTRVACCQLAPVVGQGEANVAMAHSAWTAAVAAGAELVVLPELVTSGYVFASAGEAKSVARRADDELWDTWAAELAGSRAAVVAGFCEAGDDGRLYNSAVVLDATGVRAVYRKEHLWDAEKAIFTPGSAPPPVVDLAVGRVGVLICYDLEFPEMPRALALAGADIIAVPTNWPRTERPAGEHAGEVVIAMAAARVNRVAVACCDRVGVERGQDWNGGTAVIDQSGWALAAADGAVTVAAELDLAASRHKWVSPRNDVMADRRPELYGRLTGP